MFSGVKLSMGLFTLVACRVVLGTSVHENFFQSGPTTLALKLGKGRVLRGATIPFI